MFKKSLTIFGMIILAAFLIGSNCNESTPTDDDQGDGTPDPSIYFPHVSGSWWIFTPPQGGYPQYKLELGAVFDHPQAGETQKLEIYVDNNGSGWSLYHVYYQKVTNTDVRIYQYTGSFYTLMLVMPLDVGDSWGYNIGQGNNVHCTAEESLTMPAGSFDTKKVEYDAGLPMTAWFAAGVGSFIGVKNTGWFQDNLGNPETVVLSSYHLESSSQQ